MAFFTVSVRMQPGLFPHGAFALHKEINAVQVAQMHRASNPVGYTVFGANNLKACIAASVNALAAKLFALFRGGVES